MTTTPDHFGADPAPWRHKLAERDELLARANAGELDGDPDALERHCRLEIWLDDQLSDAETYYQQGVRMARDLHPASDTMRQFHADERKRRRRIRLAVALAVVAAVVLFVAGRASAHGANGVVTVQCGKGFTFEVRAVNFIGAAEVEPWGALAGRQWVPLPPGDPVTFTVVDGPGHYEGGATIHFADGVQSATTFRVDVPSDCGQPTTTTEQTAPHGNITTSTAPRTPGTLGPAPSRPTAPTTSTTIDLCRAVVYCPDSVSGSSSPTRPTVPLAERPGPDLPPSGPGRTLPATGMGWMLPGVALAAIAVILGVGLLVIASCSPKGWRRQMAWIVAFQWWRALAGRPAMKVSGWLYERTKLADPAADETGSER